MIKANRFMYIGLLVAAIFSGLAVTTDYIRHARAGVACSLPFTFTNGTVADATQVMANYQALVNCLLNAAAAGANSDITSLSGLTTPLIPSAGGSSVYIGGTSVGTNTITLANPVPANFTLNAGVQIKFKAGGTNTGATTLNVNSLGATNVFRTIPSGVVQLVGGEIITGAWITAEYDGTEFVLLTNYNPNIPGQVISYAATGCPGGYAEANGGNVSATNFPTINTLLGTTWGTSAGNTVMPDLRGRAAFGRDSGGSGRITAAGGNFDGTIVGHTGGQQSNVVGQGNLTNFNLSVSDPGHVHGPGGGALTFLNSPGGSSSGPGGTAVSSNTTTASAMTGIGVTSGGSAIPLPTLANAAIVTMCVKL